MPAPRRLTPLPIILVTGVASDGIIIILCNISLYEGRSVYKVLSAAVFLVFEYKRFQDIRFVGNLIANICAKFHHHDINKTTSGKQ